MFGQLITIRPYLDSDAPAHAEAVRESAASGQRWLEWMTEDYPEQESLSWLQMSQLALAKNVAFDMGMFDRYNQQFVGGIALNRIDWHYRVGNLGYWVRESCANKGIASEAVRLFAENAFEAYQLRRIELVIAEHNLASRRVAEKVGAQFEALARQRVTDNGQPCYAALYSLLPEDLS